MRASHTTKALFLFCLIASSTQAQAQIPPNSLALWLRADAGVVTTGSNVTQWNDQSINGRDAVTAVGSPQLVANALCGGPVIRFNGNAGMLTPAFQTFANKRGTIFLVAKVLGGGGTLGFGTTISTYTGTVVQWQTGVYTASSTYSWYDGVGSAGASISASPPDQWGILTYQRKNDTLLKFYKSGALAANVTVADNQASVNTLKIGFNDYAPQSEFLIGDIAELIVYNRSLSDQEIYNVNVYLANKYCLNSNVAVPMASNSSICGEGSAELSATGGSNYVWYGSATDNTILASTAAFTTPVLSATDTFYVANFNDTLESVRVPVVVTVVELPAVTASEDLGICPGAQTTLTASGVVGNLVWQPGGQTTTSITVQPGSTQTYTASASNSCGTATSQVTVNLFSVSTPTIAENGAQLMASSGQAFQWYLEGGSIPDANEQGYTPIANGNYTVEVTDANGCVGVSESTQVTITSLERNINIEPGIFPNPNNGLFQLSLNAEAKGTMVEIHNALGERLLTIPVNGTNMRLNLTHLPQGIYLVRMQQNANSISQRLVIQ